MGARQLADTVRKALDGISSFADDVGPSYVALGALMELAENGEDVVAVKAESFRISAARDDALARAEKAERERDEWKDIAPDELGTPGLYCMYVDAMTEGKEAAEARVAELEEALRKIEEIITYADAPEGCVDRILDFCALAAKETT